MDLIERETIGQAADCISEAARFSIKLVEDYFEKKETTKPAS